MFFRGKINKSQNVRIALLFSFWKHCRNGSLLFLTEERKSKFLIGIPIILVFIKKILESRIIPNLLLNYFCNILKIITQLTIMSIKRFYNKARLNSLSLAYDRLSSYVTSHHLAVVPQSSAKNQFYCTVYT